MPYLTHKLREHLRDMNTRYTCACSPGREFRSLKGFNAHHHARHGAYWAGKGGKAAGRKIGKAADTARRGARARLEEAKLVDLLGRRTDQWRTRPELSGRVGVRALHRAHRHDRDHDRAGWHRSRAARHDVNAARHRARTTGRTARLSQWRAGRLEAASARHQRKAEAREGRWAPVPSRAAPEKPARERPAPASRAKPPRTAPARTAPARSTPPMGRLAPGSGPSAGRTPAPAPRPAPERTSARTPAPGPASRNGHGTRPPAERIPERAGRTR